MQCQKCGKNKALIIDQIDEHETHHICIKCSDSQIRNEVRQTSNTEKLARAKRKKDRLETMLVSVADAELEHRNKIKEQRRERRQAKKQLRSL